MRGAPIGVFDSGMGGLSVLRALRSEMPHERFIYYGDNANAPYGPRPREEIEDLALKVARELCARGAKALVVACNTATAAALEALRAGLDVPVIGMAPDLEGARACAGDGPVIVFATQATLSLPLYRDMRSRLCPDAVSIPAPELVMMVERGVLCGPEPEAYFREKLRPWLSRRIGAVVLGCTHFAFLRAPLEAVVPGVAVLDGVAPVLRRVRDALARADALCEAGEGSVEVLSSSEDAAVLARMRALLAAPAR